MNEWAKRKQRIRDSKRIAFDRRMKWARIAGNCRIFDETLFPYERAHFNTVIVRYCRNERKKRPS